MGHVTDLILSPEEAASNDFISLAASKILGFQVAEIKRLKIIRKSIDARKRNIKINLRVQVVLHDETEQQEQFTLKLQDVSKSKSVIIIGAGPAGLFAAIRCIELGLKPIIFERGKKVEERKKDIGLLHKTGFLNSDSNYCFGEGGAGTFSDGKLYTRSNKRGDVGRILQVLHLHGASDEILFEAHPHIGTNKLPAIISKMRATIESCGGNVNFNSQVTDFIIDNNQILGIKTKHGESFFADAVILSTGHSARDIFELLKRKNILTEAKAFAMGVRVEHPQQLIDSIQYHKEERGQYLPAASYTLAEQVNGRGVFSFCMCPGGVIVPASTGEEEIVVNGMSSSTRNSAWANSGIVTEIRNEDFSDFASHGAFAGLRFQEFFEKNAYKNAGKGLTAPAQRLTDFLSGKISTHLIASSYNPGLHSSPLHEWMSSFIVKSLKEGFKKFDVKMKGFISQEALLVGVESRTSSPVRIPRDKETLEHLQISGFFPCGEGAGYAGGIVSSAMDGEKCAEMVARKILS
ncbi:MAG: FAD-binding protein [Bacteroidetes bacterium RIFOXYA12_FULL_35_11]|nr:MAG: FAD-binding protein [Bacteroidetes bacterium GWF2_35_48]OFY79539.1 MAG: FAD-binding protein [Bacteroidetes bacterium RIFOXYA12_FULL_35_11]OFY92744.1 MAG: FAD-binding protein [Bacteroidetes bacterium RIFOXYC12_FULL_35_7]OFY94956.1 MAG: FAD-binding protein [Bacteroidetes bacterium RIFOXYB2_FULL_35_7]HBX53441.1 FAD-binding protein [Bacteroidales bacterium]